MKRIGWVSNALISIAAVASSLASGVAHAGKDTMEYSDRVQFQNFFHVFYVKSDGQKYTELSKEEHPLTNWQIPAQFTYDAPDNDRIKSYRLQLRLEWEVAGKSERYLGGRIQDSYKLGDRPKKIDKAVSFTLPRNIESFAVNACNATADGFRNAGQSDDTIFSRIHYVHPRIYASHAIDLQPVPPNSFASAGTYLTPSYVRFVCMKSAATSVAPAGSLQTNTSVTDVSLTVLEQSTLGGACKVNLSTVVRTNQPNTEVRYRFEHTNGAKSDIKQVVTSHSSTAMDAHWYDVPLNPQGPEAGSVRVVGVSHDFQSDWKTYSMTCNAASPGDVATTAPPTPPKRTSIKPSVELSLEPTAKVMHRGMICPTKIKVTARLHSKMPFTGTGLVTMKQGNHAFGKHDVQLTPYIVWQHDEEFDLKPWSAINASTGMTGGAHSFHGNADGSSAPPAQRFELRYVLTNNEAPVVTTPYKTIAVSCTDPQVNARIGPATDLTINRPDRPQHVKPGQLQLGQQQRPDRPQPVKPVSPKPQQQVMTAKPPQPAPRTEPVKPAGNQMKQGQSASGPQMRARAQPGAADRDCKYDPNSAVLPCADGKKRMKLINPFE